MPMVNAPFVTFAFVRLKTLTPSGSLSSKWTAETWTGDGFLTESWTLKLLPSTGPRGEAEREACSGLRTVAVPCGTSQVNLVPPQRSWIATPEALHVPQPPAF